MLAEPAWPAPSLTWFRLMASTTVIDFPLHAPPGGQTWVATMWPDGRAPHGWARRAWQPGPDGRGFIPDGVELGDVLQFGVQHPAMTGLPTGQPGNSRGAPGPAGPPAAVSTWYGYLHAVRADAIVVHGPFPHPPAAHAAAQQALVRHIHQPPEPQLRGHTPTAQLGPTTAGAPIAPAQPPASVSVTFNGTQATVGDPVHGWLVVDSERLTAALGHTPAQLAAHLNHAVPHLGGRLTGHEAPLTLAALAAQHLPHHLPTPTYAAAAPAGPTPPAAAGPTTPTAAASGTTGTPAGPAPAGPPSAGGMPPSPGPDLPGTGSIPPDPQPPTPGMSLP